MDKMKNYIVVYSRDDIMYKISCIKAGSLQELSDKIDDTLTPEDIIRNELSSTVFIYFIECVKIDDTIIQTNNYFDINRMNNYMDI